VDWERVIHVRPFTCPAFGSRAFYFWRRKGDLFLTQKDHPMVVTEKERRLIELLRSTGFGEVHVTVQNGQPVLVEEVHKSIKL